MSPLGARARSFALGLIHRVVMGRRLSAVEDAALKRAMTVDGFRKTLHRHLLGQLLRGGKSGESATVLLPALGGTFTVAASADDFAVGRTILENGTHEPHVVEVYRRLLRPGMAVLDVGANIGFHALHAATLVGREGRVWAVEPDPRNAAMLRTGVALAAGAYSVEVIEAALSDLAEDLILTDLVNPGNSGARFTGRDRSALEPLVHGADPQFRPVPAVRWDDRHEDERIDFVKIDIEGFEPHAVRGMERSVEKHHPVILSEFAPANLESIGGCAPEAYLTWFRERGYRCDVVEEPHGSLRPVGANEVPEPPPGQHHLDLLFTHPAGSNPVPR